MGQCMLLIESTIYRTMYAINTTECTIYKTQCMLLIEYNTTECTIYRTI